VFITLNLAFLITRCAVR